MGLGGPGGSKDPKRVKTGDTKPKESIPKWSPFWDRFPTCCAQFFHHFLGTRLRKLFDHLWSPRAPNRDPFGDHFGDFWGQGCQSAKRTLAAARALFSRVQGVKFGIHLATFSKTFSKVALGRSLGAFFLTLGSQVGPTGSHLGSVLGPILGLNFRLSFS